jgi:hypothetical protein
MDHEGVKRAFLATALLTAGCANMLAPSTTLTGTWVAQFSVEGSRLGWTLAQAGTTLSGTGQYAIEAGRSGTLTVTGTYLALNVTADLQYDYGLQETFTGMLTDANHLKGTLGPDGSGASSVTLVRQ